MEMARKSRWIRRCAIAVGVSIVAMVASEILTLPQGLQSQASASVTPSSVFGLYGGGGNASGVIASGKSLGSQPKYAMDFLNGSSWQSIDNPSWWISQWHGSGYSMIWGIPILPNSSYSLAQGATGAYNQYFVTLAQAMVAGGQGSAIMRPGWEFNGGWYPWSAKGQASNFVAYWQQIVNAMRSVAGANFKFEWNPTLGDTGIGDLATYYPGNSYVDYIGADVYDQQWANYPGAAVEFAQLQTETYGLNWLSAFAAQQGKPITLPEWGLGQGPGANGGPVTSSGQEVSGGDNPTFINDIAQWITTNNVFEATYFDFSFSALSATVNPNSYKALATDFGQPPPTTTPTTTTTSPPTTTPTTTNLNINTGSASYGSETSTRFTVTVSHTANGIARVVGGGRTLCSTTIRNGIGSCSLYSTQLVVGTYQIVGQFMGTTSLSGSTSGQVPYTVKASWR
jgi:hypothetical protein